MTIEELKSVPEQAVINGQRIRLVCFIGRDMMPGVEVDRRLSVTLRLETTEDGSHVQGIEIDRIWLIAGDKVAEAAVGEWLWLPEWQFGTREGPDWDDRIVDVVAHMRDSTGAVTKLIAKQQPVSYCW